MGIMEKKTEIAVTGYIGIIWLIFEFRVQAI